MVARDQIRDHELAGLWSGTPGEPHQLERGGLVASGLGGLPYIGQVRKSTSVFNSDRLRYRPGAHAITRPVVDLITGFGQRLGYRPSAVIRAVPPLSPPAEG